MKQQIRPVYFNDVSYHNCLFQAWLIVKMNTFHRNRFVFLTLSRDFLQNNDAWPAQLVLRFVRARKCFTIASMRISLLPILAVAGTTVLPACVAITSSQPQLPLIDLTLEQLSSIVVTSLQRPRVQDVLPQLALAARGTTGRLSVPGVRIASVQ